MFNPKICDRSREVVPVLLRRIRIIELKLADHDEELNDSEEKNGRLKMLNQKLKNLKEKIEELEMVNQNLKAELE